MQATPEAEVPWGEWGKLPAVAVLNERQNATADG